MKLTIYVTLTSPTLNIGDLIQQDGWKTQEEWCKNVAGDCAFPLLCDIPAILSLPAVLLHNFPNDHHNRAVAKENSCRMKS